MLTGLLLVSGWLLRRDLPLPEASLVLMTAVFFLITPVQPWYALLLLACIVLCGAWHLLPLAFAAYPLLFATILDGPAVLAGRLSFGGAALVALAIAGRRRRRTRQPGSGPDDDARRSDRRASPAGPGSPSPA